jgi:2-dehydro-3-deoxyphosphooctonate aldolase (KDO 8-P synthase)
MPREVCPRQVQVGEVILGGGRPFVLIAGPCVIESRDSALDHAAKLKELTGRLRVPFIYKSSYDKANRTSLTSFRGPGLEKGLKILAEVRREIGVPVLTDVHERQEVEAAAEVVDVLQVPAFLCRQTDFVLAVAGSGKPVNIKKGQFLAPWDVEQVVHKVLSTGNMQVIVTERGYTFGYNNLVSDFRALSLMAKWGYPVVYDATHSVQLPGGLGIASGGQREFIRPLARAAVAVGVDGLFMEVHQEPSQAKSDSATVFPLSELNTLLCDLLALDKVVKPPS